MSRGLCAPLFVRAAEIRRRLWLGLPRPPHGRCCRGLLVILAVVGVG